jgi:type IV pilus assembly protein PilA
MARRAAFTLIELLLVVVIIGILAAIALPKFTGLKGRANRSAGLSDLRNLATAQEAFYADSDRYGAVTDTAAMRFGLSRGVSALTITLTGVPTGSTGWSATVGVAGGSTCGIHSGAASRPSGMPATTPEGAAACW